MHEVISGLLGHDRVKAARQHIERTDEATLARQAALSAIPAPTGAKAERAASVAELFREAGLREVRIDEAGNVSGWAHGNGGSERGEGGRGHPVPAPVVLSAHLDTVFGPDVDVSVERRGRRLEGPGISDNARGIAALVAVAEAVVTARVRTARPILFAATVGEEGSGDLRGVKYLLNGGRGAPVAFIALDGAGMERIVHLALASRRYHLTFLGPGGHSLAAFGVPNPPNAVWRATAAAAAKRVPGKDAAVASAARDANVPIALGVPAIALGAGGKAGDAQLTTEWYENTEGALGSSRALLVTAAVAEVE